MKTLNKMIAAVIATVSMSNAIALPNVSDINTRVDNILLKIGVDNAGYSAGDFTINGSNDLGTFSTDFVGATFSGTAQDIADTLVGLNTDNTTVYVPGTIDSVNGVRGVGLEDMLLNALAFKIDEITGDVGQLVSSYSIGKLAFETALNNGDAIIAPSSVDYSNADAQSWFGVKNSLDIFTAASDAWVAGIAELNATTGDGNSHFDANFVVGAEVGDYDSTKDVVSNVSLTRSIFSDAGVETLVTVDLGTSYDRDSLVTASVALGSTTSSERNGIVSGETIFGNARHFNDTTGYAGDILNSLDAAALTTTVVVNATSTTHTNTNGWSFSDNGDGTWSLLNASGDFVSNSTDAEVATAIAGWNDTGLFLTMTSTNDAYNGATIKYDSTAGLWRLLDGSVSFDQFAADGSYIGDPGSAITGGSATFNEIINLTTVVGIDSSSTTTINSGALSIIKNSEIRSYAESFLLNTVDTTSPAWLQAL